MTFLSGIFKVHIVSTLTRSAADLFQAQPLRQQLRAAQPEAKQAGRQVGLMVEGVKKKREKKTNL